MTEIVISGAARTAMGGLQGVFASVAAPQLGGTAIAAAMSDAQLDPGAVSQLSMGCVLPAGIGQAPARQAGFAAGLSDAVPATTVNKMCGSGMKTLMDAADHVTIDPDAIVVAGGMESMTNAPYLLSKMRGGARLGHGEVKDSMFLDGLEDAYDTGRLMGTFAEDCAEAYQFTREAQDEFALTSLERAQNAQKGGGFDSEIASVSVKQRKGCLEVSVDEQPGNARPEKIPLLKPVFRKDGTVTPANSSSISDGAAAMVVTSRDTAEASGLNIRARILGHATHAQAPGWFTTAPVPAARKLLEQLGWSIGDVDLWEVNEAFAVVPMAFMHELDVPHERLNIHGGACALGHPIGASGARIVVTLLNALEQKDLKRGVAAICIGGGEGTAIAVERL